MLRAHDPVEVGTPFYAATPSPQKPSPGAPTVHKFDRTDYVPRFLSEVAGAEAGTPPPSVLGKIAPLGSGVPDFDTDALDFLGGRFRKLFQPSHFRFYLAACELRCRVPGFPAPDRKKVKKVELVLRRVAIKRNSSSVNGPPTVEADREWAWVPIPEPSVFPASAAGPPEATLALAPRLTGNTHTWWPVPKGEAALEGEQRFPMSRAFAPGIEKRGVYFAILPLSSGEMYGPRPVVPKAAPNSVPKKDPGKPPVALTAASIVPLKPLVPAPSSFPLSAATMQAWRASWQMLLGLFTGNKVSGPRPKLESPPLWVDTKKNPLLKPDGSPLKVKDAHGNVIDPPVEEQPAGGWAYVVRCVATIDEGPGCVIEKWTDATEPAVIAPHYDPFGGRPTQIDLPSLTGIAKMIGGLSPAQIAQRGGNGFGVKHEGGNVAPIDKTPKMGLSIGGGICFFGIPLFTITAYLMFSIALVLLLPVLAILLALKFCIPPEVDLEID